MVTGIYKALRWLAIAALLFNALGALAGGFLLMYAPEGSMLRIPLSYLAHSPFPNYFIPGLILFVFNGLLSIVVTFLTLVRQKDFAVFIFIQGVVLSGWIFIQIVMMQGLHFQHVILGGIGLFLMWAGNTIYIQQCEQQLGHASA